MAKIFYDHLVVREEITAELDKYLLTVDEREEMIRLIDETLHHHVLNIILTKLPKEKHQEFLQKFHQSPSDLKLLDYLGEQIRGIDKEIAMEAQKVKKEILSEIKRSQKT